MEMVRLFIKQKLIITGKGECLRCFFFDFLCLLRPSSELHEPWLGAGDGDRAATGCGDTERERDLKEFGIFDFLLNQTLLLLNQTHNVNYENQKLYIFYYKNYRSLRSFYKLARSVWVFVQYLEACISDVNMQIYV